MRFNRKKIAVALLAVIFVAGLALRMVNLSTENFSLDESFSVANAQHNLADITTTISNDNYPPLYQYLLHIWLQVFGVSEAAARSLSVVIGLASVVAVYYLGRAIFNKNTGIMAALITAASAFHIEFSQEARMYILVMLWSTLTTYYLWKSIQNYRFRYLFSFTVFTILSIYTHYFALVWLGAQVIFLILYFFYIKPPVKVRRNFLFSLLAIVIAFGPWLPFLVRKMVLLQDNFWLTSFAPRVTDFFVKLPEFFYLHWQYGQTISIFHWSAPLYYIIIFGLILAALVRIYKQLDLDKKAKAVKFSFVIILLLAPFIASFITKMYSARYLIIILPILYILLAHGLLWFKKIQWRVILIALVLILMLPSWIEVTRVHYDWPAVGQRIQSQEKESDAIILYSPMHRYLFDYYYDGQIESEGFFPHATVAQRDDESEILKYSGWLMIKENVLAGEMEYLTAGHQRAWLVSYQQPILDKDNIVKGWLDNNYNLASQSEFPFRFEGDNINVLLYTKE